MVRCKEFYEHFEKKGNFCEKSECVVRQVEHYIDYIRRRKLKDFGGYRISNAALDPLISIEDINSGKVHELALKELKRLIRRRKVMPEDVTRRIVVELINEANSRVEDIYQLKNIPNIRSKIGEFEHDIGEIGFEARNTFDELKKDIGAKNNNELVRIMLEICIRNPEEMMKIKEELVKKDKDREYVEGDIEIIST